MLCSFYFNSYYQRTLVVENQASVLMEWKFMFSAFQSIYSLYVGKDIYRWKAGLVENEFHFYYLYVSVLTHFSSTGCGSKL